MNLFLTHTDKNAQRTCARTVTNMNHGLTPVWSDNLFSTAHALL